jgi:GTPase SAR1 family protein
LYGAALQEKIKLLLLGAGESGKSTIFKQMKILYGVVSEEEKRQVRPVVFNNTITSMKIVVEQVGVWKLEDTIAAKEAFEMIKLCDEAAVIDLRLGNAVKALWADPGLQKVWDRRSEFQVVESVKFYFNEIDRIMQPDYLPSQQDVLYARVRTSGIVTERYEIDGSTFEMYDVGGQRNERKKWIHCFDDVTAVIFVAALSEYDQSLFEDATTNRMVEAIELFGEICNNRYFQESSMILFLNKADLFAEKIKRVDIKGIEAFADFPGGLGDAEPGIEYFTALFLGVNTNPSRSIYQHVTCATDTENVNRVFSACKDIILRGNLKDSGFI